jgi:hypothetical protein
MPTDQPTTQPISSDQGWRRLVHVLAVVAPAHLYHAHQAARGIRALRGAR